MHLFDKRAGNLVLEHRGAPTAAEEPDAHGGSGNILVRTVVQQQDARVGGSAHTRHEARMPQLFLDGRDLVDGSGEVGLAGDAGESGHEPQVQVVQARLHHGARLPFDVGLQLGLQKTVQGVAVQHAVLAVLVEVEGAVVTQGLSGRWNDHLQAEPAAIEHQLYGADKAEGCFNGAWNQFHDAVRFALHNTARIYVRI